MNLSGIMMQRGTLLLLCSILLGKVAVSQTVPVIDTPDPLFPMAPISRGGSGTAWLPDISPVDGYDMMAGSWNLLMQGNIFARYTDQDVGNSGGRGGHMIDVPNWFAIAGSHGIWENGQLMFRGTFSFERLTEGRRGYPLLFQTGEIWNDVRLPDRQPPRDLFSELALAYSYQIDDNVSTFLYAGLPGEPALGPPAFMQRPSARSNPDAPLGYYRLDGTPTSFGVTTLGVVYHVLKLDASLFNGREPDENRYNIDRPRFDSYSLRVSFNPSMWTAAQISIGRLKSPYVMQQTVNVTRVTASFLHNYRFDNGSNIATALIWGMNKPTNNSYQHAFLLESEYGMQKQTLFTRFEFVQDSGPHLAIPNTGDHIFPIGSLTLGVTQQIVSMSELSVQAGIQASIYKFDSALSRFYGGNPFSLELFLRIRPPHLTMSDHALHRFGL